MLAYASIIAGAQELSVLPPAEAGAVPAMGLKKYYGGLDERS